MTGELSLFYNKKSQYCILFTKNSLQPKRVIFIDDKMSNIQDVVLPLKSRVLNALAYGCGADERVKAYDPEIADVQWKAFPRILTDKGLKCSSKS